MNNLEDAAENFRLVYNKAWALFSGVRPMTQEEAMQMMKAMKPIIDPDIIFFAYFNDEPIGFFITVPDLNRIIGKFNGKFGLIQKLRLMWELKVRKSCDRIFGIIFGIAPDVPRQGRRVGHHGTLLAFHDGAAEPLQDARAGMDRRFQPRDERMIETYVCATRHKIHTTYRYLFDRTKEFHRCPRLGVETPRVKPKTVPI